MEDSVKGDFRIKGLTYFRSGIVFFAIATLIIPYVFYQIGVGKVFTKSGELPLGSGMAFGWLLIEAIAAGVGIVRGLKMLRRSQ